MNIVPPAVAEALGWTLVHFIWQGVVLALMLYIFAGYTRAAVTRYWAAVVTLALMVTAPAVTFFVLRQSVDAGKALSTRALVSANFEAMTSTLPESVRSIAVTSLPSVNWPACFAALWLAGVLAFSMRAFGGWLLVQRLYRKERQLVGSSLLRRCEALRKQLGIKRAVRFHLSRAIDAPAVIGWFRPVVLVPFTALTGLSPEQLEAIIAHELAHIRRFDCFVNLFQIAAETLLFYHPAVWWVSRTIRAERENCCDDIAVSVCGDAGVYARALTVVESWRAMPAFVMAANGSPLKFRIERLLGLKAMARDVSSVSIALVGLVCAAGVLFASTAFEQPAARRVPSKPVLIAQNEVKPAPAPASKPRPAAEPAPRRQSAARNSSSYIEEMKAVGLTDLDVDQLIALKIQGVTPEYVRAIRNTWPNVKVDEIIAMKIQGVNPSDAAAYKSVGFENLDAHRLIAFRIHGVTPDYVRSLKAAGFTDVTADHVIAAKIQGITPEFIQKVRSHGFTNLSLSKLIQLKIADVF
jgi:beta-lactamase regulating signal transducer with metallopeptidase domain